MMIIQRLQSYTSSELSDALDALGVEGALQHIKPLMPGYKLAGPAFTISYQAYQTKPHDFQNAANYIDHVPPGAVIVIDNQGREDCTVWGGILTRVAQNRQIAGTVINGAARDSASICDSGYPLFSRAVFMRSGKNRVQKVAQQTPVCINGITINPDDVVFGDDNGVLIIPKHLLEEVLSKAVTIHKNEQRIIKAIDSGVNLEEARQRFNYHKPWQDKKNT